MSQPMRKPIIESHGYPGEFWGNRRRSGAAIGGPAWRSFVVFLAMAFIGGIKANAQLMTLLGNLDPKVELAIANSLWGQRDVTFNPDFVISLNI